MDDEQAIKALINDLNWQIDQIGSRRIKNAAGNAFVPTLFRRRLEQAIEQGGVVDHVQDVVRRPPSQGYRRLAAHESLDLACEALVADGGRPYAGLFSDVDRAAARERLAPHAAAIAARQAEHRARMDAVRARLREEGLPRRDALDAQLRRNRAGR